jgi:hypothetical protein
MIEQDCEHILGVANCRRTVDEWRYNTGQHVLAPSEKGSIRVRNQLGGYTGRQLGHRGLHVLRQAEIQVCFRYEISDVEVAIGPSINPHVVDTSPHFRWTDQGLRARRLTASTSP